MIPFLLIGGNYMFPYIILFGKTITSYTIMVIIGILMVGWFCLKQANKHQMDENEVICILLAVAIGIFLGGHLLYGIVNIKMFIHFITNINKVTSFSMLVICIHEIFGGSVFYGGLLGGLLTGYLYTKRKEMPFFKYSYPFLPAIPLFHMFGRIGCFLSGCCFGIPSSIGFLYKNPLILGSAGITRFPVQLLEACYNGLLYIVLYQLQKKNKYQNTMLFIYLWLYALARFFIEFLRGDTYRGYLGIFSTSQIISIIILTFVIVYIPKINNHK